MEKNPEDEILLEPQWPLVFDGNGYDSILVGGIPAKDQDGLEVYDLTLKPSPRTRKRYNLRHPQEINLQGNLSLRISKNLWVPWNMLDKANERYIYLKSFTHEETSLSNLFKDTIIKIEGLQRRILLLEAQNLRLFEIAETAKTNPQKFMKQSMELFQDTGKVMADMVRKDEKNA